MGSGVVALPHLNPCRCNSFDTQTLIGKLFYLKLQPLEEAQDSLEEAQGPLTGLQESQLQLVSQLVPQLEVQLEVQLGLQHQNLQQHCQGQIHLWLSWEKSF